MGGSDMIPSNHLIPAWSLFALIACMATALADNYTTGTESAAKFGVHEIELTGDGAVANPFDTLATVTFIPPSGKQQAKTVNAFHDGGATWRARVYVNEIGPWTWFSACKTDQRLDGLSGTFEAVTSKLRGRLLPHPLNSRHWITEDGRWFLNLNDTAYYLLCRQDRMGNQISDEQVRRYVRDDVAHGITSVRCSFASRDELAGPGSWTQWFFVGRDLDRFRLDNLQCADRRLHILLEEFPDLAVQFILFPLERYASDDRFWTALKPGQRDRLLRHLMARFAAYPQIFWLFVNDSHYGEKFPNNNAMAREVGAYLQQHDPWQHPRSTGHARMLSFVFGAEDWATYIHIEHQHDLGALQYNQYHQFVKPVFLGEDRYEDDHGSKLDPVLMRYWQRRLFWAWLLSGGTANYGGRWWALQPYSDVGMVELHLKDRPKASNNKPLTGLDSVRYIRDYFETRSIDLAKFEPHSDLVRDATGAVGVRSPRLMSRGQEEFLIYHPHAKEDGQNARPDGTCAAALDVDLRQTPGEFTVEWYRAEDGEEQAGEPITGGDWHRLTAPWVGQDCIVRLQRQS